MAKADDPFLAWLGQLTGPLTAHQSRLVLGALIDCLRHRRAAEARKEWRKAFYHWWKPGLLMWPVNGHAFEEIMQRVRRPPKPGRPAGPNQIRARYHDLVALAELLATRSPMRGEFIRELKNWQRIGVCPTGRTPLPPRLYSMLDQPERMVLELLSATTGKSVKAIRRKTKDPAPKAPPAL